MQGYIAEVEAQRLKNGKLVSVASSKLIAFHANTLIYSELPPHPHAYGLAQITISYLGY